MHFLRTCLMYVFLYVFACIFVCMCMYVCCIFVVFVCMCVYCLYVVHISRLAILPAKNTGKYMQYNTDSYYMHNICTTYIHIHTPKMAQHTCKYIHIHTHMDWFMCLYVVCMTLFKRRIYTSYMHIYNTYRNVKPDIHSIQNFMYLYVSYCIWPVSI
jgi:hypothetical protein